MIISTKKGTPQVELDRIVDNFEKQGLSVTMIRGTDYNVFGLVGDTTKIAEKDVLANPWVENVTRCVGTLQARKPPVPPCGYRGGCQRRQDRRQRPHRRYGRPLQHRGRGAHHRNGAGGQGGRRQLPARRRLQAPAPAPTPSRAWAPRGFSTLVKAREVTGLPIVSELMDEAHIR